MSSKENLTHIFTPLKQDLIEVQSSSTKSILILKASNVKNISNFEYISWRELSYFITNPPVSQAKNREEAKVNSEVIAAHDAPCKTKQAAIEHNNFTLLRLDIDDTKQSASDIKAVLLNHDIESFVIHTTASHQYKGKGNRYRVYIELEESLNYKEWANAETYLSSLFKEADDCASRPSQIMYLPFLFEDYEYIINYGKAINRQHHIIEKSQSYCEQLTHLQHQKQQESLTKQQNKPFNEKLIGTQISIIDLIEQSYSWEILLSSHGYKRKGKAWLAPESTSGVAGAYLLKSNDGKTRFYSHHTNDPCATGKAIDKLDFISIREFDDHRGNTIKYMARTYFPKAHAHNLLEFKISKYNERDA